MPIKKTPEKKTSVKKVGGEKKSKSKTCPYCGNEIRENAIKCQYCKEFLDSPNKISNEPTQDVVKYSMNNIEYKENSFASFITGTTLNRIGRAKYVARGFVLTILLYACLFLVVTILLALAGGDAEDTIMAICIIPFVLVLLYGNIILNNKRLHDIGWSGWCQLLALVPIANIVLLICWYFVPGDKGENQYGERSESKTREKVVTIIYVILLIILFIAGLSSDY